MLGPRSALTLAVVLLAVSGCAKSAQQYLESGNRYFSEKKYTEAAIEFQNATQKDPKLGAAHLRLADAAAQLSDPRTALREYINASDLMPGNTEAQLKAGGYLLLVRRFDDAETRAKRVLAKDPKNLEARLLLANASFQKNEIDTAIAQAEEAIRLDPKAVRAYASLGQFEQAKGDTAAAEKAFRQAVEMDPSSVNAHLALGSFLFSTGRQREAEASLEQAHQLAPKNSEAARMLAAFYIVANRAAEAEPFLKLLADATEEPGPRLALADYYAGLARVDEAVTELTRVAATPKGFSQAKIRLAAIDYSRNLKPEAHKTIDDVLAREPRNAAALLTKARFLADEKKTDEAIAKAKAAVAADPNSVSGHYMLGGLYSSRNHVDEAIKEFSEVLRLNPRAAAAELQLSRLQLLNGSAASAVRFAEQATEAQPNDPNIRLMLVRTLMAQGNLARAESELKAVAAQYPNAAPVLSATGSLSLMKGDRAGARKAYERSAAIDPNALEPLVGLVTMDIAARKGPDARSRVDARLAKTPNQPEVLVLAARTYATLGDPERAEQFLLKAIEVAPENLQAYGLLGQLYVGQNKLDQARERFSDLATRQPKPVGAETMVGMILQMQGKTAEAKTQYEKVLTLDARSPVAANNLAWMYAESGSNLDLAVQLAQTAKAGLPEAPEVDDTLGWVYYRKNLPGLALAPLQRAIGKSPKDPVYHYHLGMVYAKSGDAAQAKASLQKALALDPAFDGATEARKTLATLR